MLTMLGQLVGMLFCFLLQIFCGATATDCVNNNYKAAYGKAFTGTGILTYYSDGGGGACGTNEQLGTDPLYGKMFAAASYYDYWGGGNANLDPICLNLCALVSYNGLPAVEVKVMDQCWECSENWLDLSQTAFAAITGMSKDSIGTLGKVTNATIKFQSCSLGPSGTAGWAAGVTAAEVCPNSDWTATSGTTTTTTGSSAATTVPTTVAATTTKSTSAATSTAASDTTTAAADNTPKDCVNNKYKASYGKTFTGNGIMTYSSDGGGGACGPNEQLGSDPLYGKMFAGVSYYDYWGGGNANLDPICLNFCALVSYNGGRAVEVKVMDQCWECSAGWINLSQTAYAAVTGLPKDSIGIMGKVYNATIQFQSCSLGPSGTAGWASGVTAAEICPNSDWTA